MKPTRLQIRTALMTLFLTTGCVWGILEKTLHGSTLATVPVIEQMARRGFYEADLKIDPSTLTLQGNRDSAVIFLEFSDYRCASCLKFHGTVLPQLYQEYIETNKMAYAFIDAPLSLSDEGTRLAQGAACAQIQEKFWPFHDWLFSHPQTPIPDAIEQAVKSLGLDSSPFQTCLSGKESRQKILDSQKIAERLGVSATPVFFVGWRTGDLHYTGKWVKGAEHYFIYKYLIERALKASGQ